MKKIYLMLSAFGLLTISAVAQNKHIIVLEQFTGETCPPCAPANERLDALIPRGSDNANKIIILRHQTAIPSTPPAGALYHDTRTDVSTRMTYYAINSAPSALLNGQSKDHPTNLVTQQKIDELYAIEDAPFTININSDYTTNDDSILTTLYIRADAAVSLTGDLKLIVDLVENEIIFDKQTGTNGEKEFRGVLRQFLTGPNGSVLPKVWAMGDDTTIVLKSKIPSFIYNKEDLSMVVFVQDNSNKAILQANIDRNIAPALFAKITALSGINSSEILCTNKATPQITLRNDGRSAITSFDVKYKVGTTAAEKTLSITDSIAVGTEKTVTLTEETLSNGFQTFSSQITKINNSAFVQKKPSLATYNVQITTTKPQIYQDFKAAAFPPTNFGLLNPDKNITFERRAGTGAAKRGSGSVQLNVSASKPGEIDEFILPKLNMDTNASSATFSFFLASRDFIGTSNNTLSVSSSIDCGVNWTELYALTGADLNNAGSNNTAFYTNPASSDWTDNTVNLTNLIGQKEVLLKVSFLAGDIENGYVGPGNYTHLDEFRVYYSQDPLAVNTIFVKNASLYPNPSNGVSNLEITSVSNTEATINVTNALGQIVKTINNISLLANQSQNIEVNLSNLSSGIYNVSVNNQTGSIFNTKLSVIK